MKTTPAVVPRYAVGTLVWMYGQTKAYLCRVAPLPSTLPAQTRRGLEPHIAEGAGRGVALVFLRLLRVDDLAKDATVRRGPADIPDPFAQDLFSFEDLLEEADGWRAKPTYEGHWHAYGPLAVGGVTMAMRLVQVSSGLVSEFGRTPYALSSELGRLLRFHPFLFAFPIPPR